MFNIDLHISTFPCDFNNYMYVLNKSFKDTFSARIETQIIF